MSCRGGNKSTDLCQNKVIATTAVEERRNASHRIDFLPQDADNSVSLRRRKSGIRKKLWFGVNVNDRKDEVNRKRTRWRTRIAEETVTLARACESSVYASNMKYPSSKNCFEEEEEWGYQVTITDMLHIWYVCIVSSKTAAYFWEDD